MTSASPSGTPRFHRLRRVDPRVWAAGVCALGLALGWTEMLGVGPRVDESVHLEQIHDLEQGRWRLDPRLTTLPGYHAVVAGTLRLVGASELPAARAVTLVLSATTLLVFGALCSRYGSPKSTAFRVVQLAFLPILFPFFFLVYTDVPALLLVLLAVWLADRPRPVLAPLAALAAVLVRQSNIVWVAFVALVHLRALRRRDGERGRVLRRSEILTHAAPYGLLGVGFVVFVLLQGGVAMSQKRLHPVGTLHMTNLYFFLFILLVCCLPLLEARGRRILDLLRRRPWIPALLIPALFPFAWSFELGHPHNRYLTFLRNLILDFFRHDDLGLLVFYGACCAALLSLAVTPLKRPVAYALYPLGALFLASHWLVEQRYYLVPLALWQVFREDAPIWAEWRQIVYGAILTALIHLGITRGGFFL